MKVAVITGANRGLGLETCRQLAGRGYTAVLTARDAARAAEAAAAIGVDHLQLDVTSADSVAAAAAELARRYGSIAALVNNAGVALDGFDAGVARRTIAVNVDGAIAVTDALLPLFGDDGTITNVSSGMGELSCLSDGLRRRFADPGLDRAGLAALMSEFVADVGAGRCSEAGWPRSAYRVSKAGLNAFTRIVARELGDSPIRVNAVCPGWVQTDMGGRGATRAVGEGAASIVWAVDLDAGGPTGGFFRDGRAIPW